MFYFDSLGQWLQMDGHGVYVWPCYVITWAVLAYLLAAPILRRRRWLRQRARRAADPHQS